MQTSFAYLFNPGYPCYYIEHCYMLLVVLCVAECVCVFNHFHHFNIFELGTDPTSLCILFFFFLLEDRPCLKNLRLRHFKSDRDEIWLECSWNKYASIDGVGFLIWRHTFKFKVCYTMRTHEGHKRTAFTVDIRGKPWLFILFFHCTIYTIS